MLYILSLLIGFILGCIGMYSAIIEELQEIKKYTKNLHKHQQKYVCQNK